MSESDPLNYMDFAYGDSPIPVIESEALPHEYEWLVANALGIDPAVSSDMTVRAAYAFDRRNRVSFDSFGDARNPRGSSDDEIVVQVSFKLSTWNDARAAVDDIAGKVRNAAIEKAYAAKVAKAEAMEADMAKMAEQLEKARQELTDFKK